MTPRRNLSATVATALAVFATVWPGLAHEGATGIVKDRMDAMESMARSMKAIRLQLQKKPDLGAIRREAQSIQSLASKMTSMFPPGSNRHPSEATAAIWKSWSDFESIARATESESAKLAKMDTSDVGALSSQHRAVSETCSRCHESYRAKMKHD